jgi:hypothetical protein
VYEEISLKLLLMNIFCLTLVKKKDFGTDNKTRIVYFVILYLILKAFQFSLRNCPFASYNLYSGSCS